MNKINIQSIVEAEKNSIRTTNRKHRVFLHSDLTLHFNDLKQAKIFIVKTNDFLTFKFFELNEIYIELFTYFRRGWFYLDVTQESLINSTMKNIDYLFKLSFTRSEWANGSHYVFNWINQIIDSLKTITNVLKGMQQFRGNWAETRIMQTLTNRLEFILKEVFSYGQTI